MTIEQTVEQLNVGASVDVTTSEIVHDSKSRRAECEKAAERVWAARKVTRNMCDHGTDTTCDACSETSRSQRGKR
jgi:hypothetical protein